MCLDPDSRVKPNFKDEVAIVYKVLIKTDKDYYLSPFQISRYFLNTEFDSGRKDGLTAEEIHYHEIYNGCHVFINVLDALIFARLFDNYMNTHHNVVVRCKALAEHFVSGGYFDGCLGKYKSAVFTKITPFEEVSTKVYETYK